MLDDAASNNYLNMNIILDREFNSCIFFIKIIQEALTLSACYNFNLIAFHRWASYEGRRATTITG